MSNTFFRQILSSSGVSLVELTIGVGLIGGLALVGSQLMEKAGKNSKDSSVKSDLATIRTQIISTLQHEPSFSATLTNYTNVNTFACLKIEGASDDCSNASGEFRLYRKTANDKEFEIPYVSLSSDTSRGFSKTGIVCQEFNANPGQGSDSCPYKFVASWTAICPKVEKIRGATSVETKCRNPLFNVHVKLLFNPRDPSKFPLLPREKADVRLVLSQSGSDRNKLCGLAGNGYYDESVKKCVLLKLGEDSCDNFCGAGRNSFVEGFYEDGSLNCSCDPVPEITCPGNEVLIGVNNDGSIQCAPSLIAGLTFSGAISNTPETYFEYLKTKYQEAVDKKNTAQSNQTAALGAMTAAQATYDAADNAARAAQAAVDAARAVAGSAPTSEQITALQSAVDYYNQKMHELTIARAQLDKASRELEEALKAEQIAKQRMDEQAAKL